MNDAFRSQLRPLPDFPPACRTSTPPRRTRAANSDNPDWQLYALRPTELEFWQARPDRRQVRHRFGPDGIPLARLS